MKVTKVYPRGFASNAFILTADDKTCVVIDPSQPSIVEKLASMGLECKYVLLTHGHFDHIGGCGALYEKGAQICCGEREKEGIFGIINSALVDIDELPPFKVERTFKDGEKFNLCGIDFTALSTPGHTAGSTCYIADDCLFSGDTLFFESVGRTDLPTGSTRELYDSVKRLYALDGDYKVCCGHEDDTTLSHERENNPYIR